MALSALYAIAMMATVVGIMFSIAGEGWYTPTSMFLYLLIASFILSALFHIHEFFDLIYGVVYFICIPAGYLFLVIYAICNLNNISWGTRETQKAVLENPSHKKKRKSKIKAAEEEFEDAAHDVINDVIKQVKAERARGNKSCLGMFSSMFTWANNMFLLNTLRSMQQVMHDEESSIADDNDQRAGPAARLSMGKSLYKKSMKRVAISAPETLDDESWANIDGKPKELKEDDSKFWVDFIRTYLAPLDHDEKEKKDVADALLDYRNKMAFSFFFLNALWITIMTAINQIKATISVDIYVNGDKLFSLEPLGFLFLVMFAILLLVQLLGMFAHRYSTLLHVIAATEIRGALNDSEKHREMIKDLGSRGDIGDNEYDDRGSKVTSGNNKNEAIFESRRDLEMAHADLSATITGSSQVPHPKFRGKQRLDLGLNYRKTVKRTKTLRKPSNGQGHDNFGQDSTL